MKQKMRAINFSYPIYNSLLFLKLCEVIIKEFIKFVLLSNDYEKKRFFWERLGIFLSTTVTDGKDNWFWIHANAIGEVNASCSLIHLIKQKYPASQILLTTANFSADKRATQLNFADTILFFPYDIPFIIRRFLKVFKPLCIIVIECDIWPNFVKICKKKGIPVLVVSGVFTNDSGRSLGARYFYDYIFKLSKDVLKNIDYFCIQTGEDAERLSYIVGDNKNISVTGNLKFNCLDGKALPKEKLYYQKIFNIKESDPVIVAGNVHRKEDKIVIDAFRLVREKIPNAVLILAPRFIEDTSSIEQLLKNNRFNYIRKSKLCNKERVNEDIILLDTMGELVKIYSIAKVAFVGGSLVYLGEIFGGHNILEPAVLGVPVLFGPHMHNFQNLADLFCKRQAAIQIDNQQELVDGILKLLTDTREIQRIVSNAMDIFEENRFVAEKTFSLIQDKLKPIHND